MQGRVVFKLLEFPVDYFLSVPVVNEDYSCARLIWYKFWNALFWKKKRKNCCIILPSLIMHHSLYFKMALRELQENKM